MGGFNNKPRPRTLEGKDENKKYLWKSIRELTLNVFKSGIFPIKTIKGEGFKISTPKQIFQ